MDWQQGAGMTRHVNDLVVISTHGMVWWLIPLPPPNPYSIPSFLHPIAKTEAILSPQKLEYSPKDIWSLIQTYDIIIIMCKLK